jgi:hypothetical protein
VTGNVFGGRARVRLSLLLIAVAAAPVLPEAGSASAPAAQAAHSREIAVATLGEFRVTVTATRVAEEGGIPTATVYLAAYRNADDTWERIDRQVVGRRGAWFWYPLTGGGAVCTLSTSDSQSHPTELSLLLSASTGCSESYRFQVRDGRLVAA